MDKENPFSSVEKSVPHRLQGAVSSPVEGEISVFGAERYFNMKLDDDGLKRDNHVDHDLHQMKPIHRPGTPSTTSEASWNSQTALMQSFMRNRWESKQRSNKADARSFFSGLSCTGSCSDGKSVYVNQRREHGRKEYRKESIHQANHKLVLDRQTRQRHPRFQVKDEFDSRSFEKMSVGSSREDYSASAPPVVKRHLVKEKTTKVEDPRNSLEVFGSGAIKREDTAMNLERKLSMLTWDAIPNAPKVPTVSGSSQHETDSDDSSDLFEIENISCSNSQMLFTRQASDGMSSCVTPYEPSEASIEWSVVTASAADFSVNTDTGERKNELTDNIRTPGLKTAKAKEEPQRSRPSGILGCKSHKAVSVAETAYRINYDQKARRPPSRLAS